MLALVTNTIILVASLASLAGPPQIVTTHLPHEASDVQALGALVGEWQTDTVDGVSARSSCAWTPRHGAVLCEQRIERKAGWSSALNLFTADSTDGAYALYVLSRSGDAMSPIPLVIRGRQWYYGGTAPSADGRFYRTVNDFSQTDVYTWRQETSADGKEWTAGIHGQSRRIR